jgi:hypothetical protein
VPPAWGRSELSAPPAQPVWCPITTAGQVKPGGTVLRDGNLAGAGDWILTRSNDRRPTTSSGRDWVKNGDAWLVTRLTAGTPPPQSATR